MVSISDPSRFWPRRITEPFPNARSIWVIAASSARCRSSPRRLTTTSAMSISLCCLLIGARNVTRIWVLDGRWEGPTFAKRSHGVRPRSTACAAHPRPPRTLARHRRLQARGRVWRSSSRQPARQLGIGHCCGEQGQDLARAAWPRPAASGAAAGATGQQQARAERWPCLPAAQPGRRWASSTPSCRVTPAPAVVVGCTGLDRRLKSRPPGRGRR